MLTVYFGPMFSGKTSKLIKKLEDYGDIRKKVIGINSGNDSRSSKIVTNNNAIPTKNEVVSTHASRGVHTGGKVCWVKIKNLLDLDVTNYQVIGVDEAHWFTDLVTAVESWLKLDKIIIVVGLDADCLQRPFGDILKLVPYATKVVKLNATCHRHLDKDGSAVVAPFTRKKGTVDPNNINDPGASDKYEAVCLQHLYD